MRTVLALCAALLIGIAAGAPGSASASASPSPAGVPPVSVSLGDGVAARDASGGALETVQDFSGDGVVLRAATTAGGVPVIVSGVTGGAADGGPEEVRGGGVGYAATPGAVELAWTAVAGAHEYEVYRDDTLLGRTGELSFVDGDVRPGAAHAYVIEADVLLEPQRVVDPETGETVYPDRWAGYRLYVPVAVPPEDPDRLSSATADFEATTTAQATSTFTYKTFIAEPDAPGFPCVVFPTNTYFGGDDRDWVSGTGGSFRTRMTATADWAAESLTTSRDVGETVNYNSDGTVRERRTASMSDMNFTDTDVTSTRASFMIDHSAANPFCESTGGAVRYNIAVSVYRAGIYITHGWRRPVPHHEAYVRHDAEAWHTVLRRTNSGFECLTGVCGTEDLNTVGSW